MGCDVGVGEGLKAVPDSDGAPVGASGRDASAVAVEQGYVDDLARDAPD